MLDFLKNDEKKVEYVELIYDLIFVYIIGRNNSLIHHISGGFIDWELYLTYTLCTLITIQIWYSTTLFINRFGSGSPAEYIGLFINMYFLYYMASGTQVHWTDYYYRYNVAWMLILLNLIVQYLIKSRKIHRLQPWAATNVKMHVTGLAAQVAGIALGLLVFALTAFPATPAALIIGFVFSLAGRRQADLVALDFAHLTERVMLYIVFTFGEMIIAIASYFDGQVNLNTIFYSLMGFSVVVGLFMSYGFFYDRILDREMHITGNVYMFIHVFIIFALSNLTNALEFMREPEIALLPKNIYLVASFAVYYVFLFLTAPFTKNYRSCRFKFLPFYVSLAVFIVLMLCFYQISYISITLSVLFVFWTWLMEYRYWKQHIV